MSTVSTHMLNHLHHLLAKLVIYLSQIHGYKHVSVTNKGNVIHKKFISILALYLGVTLGSSLEVHKPFSLHIPPKQVCPMQTAHLYKSLQISRVKLLAC